MRADRVIKSNNVSAMALNGKVQVSCLPSVSPVPEVALVIVRILARRQCLQKENKFIKIKKNISVAYVAARVQQKFNIRERKTTLLLRGVRQKLKHLSKLNSSPKYKLRHLNNLSGISKMRK